MKSKQHGVCKPFVVVLLSMLQLSSTLPTHSKDSTDKTNCHPLLATELDSNTISDPVVRSAISVDESHTFLLRSPLRTDDEWNISFEVFKRGKMCKGAGNELGVDLQVIVGENERSGKVHESPLSGPMLLIAPPFYMHSKDTLLKITCEQSVRCLNITFTDLSRISPKRLSPRAAVGHMTSEVSSHDSKDGVRIEAIVGGVIMTVIGLLVLVSVTALCGGSNTYEPTTNPSAFNSSENQVEAVPPAEVKEVKVDEVAVAPKQNGGVSQNQQPSTTSAPAESKRQSLSPPPDPAPFSNSSERQERARTLSARSFDPLPEIPKLDLAETLPVKENEDKDDEDKEDPYSYARVPKADGVPHSDSSDEDDTNSPDGVSSPSKLVAPYGKVVSSDKAITESLGDGEYAEVIGESGRGRSITAPVDPSQVGVLRDTRAFTESAAHLPLPAIPKGRPSVEEDNEMYDSIPETMSSKVARPAKIKKESLYESVDEMAEGTEDMYESVPEELKPDSPVVLTPNTPDHLPILPTTPPRPPDSPIPTHHPLVVEPKPEESHGKGKKGDKKALEKTLSASDQLEKQKRSFSLFGRKKATSISAGVGKSRKKSEKEGQPSKPHQGDPLPDIPKQNLSPRTLTTPNLTFPSTLRRTEEEEDTYDKPQLPLPLNLASGGSESDSSKVHTTEEAKARAKTLPAGLRSPGFKFRQDLPLPEVPEHSRQGLVTVTHKRLLEPGSEKSKPYDMVHISPPPPQLDEEDEPNYDTVRPDLIINPSLEVRNGVDPGYDKVGIRLEGEEENPVLSDEDKTPEESSSPGADMEVKITALPGTSSLEDSVVEGPVPEHDEIGYARVPEMYLMRKRAMSASQGVKGNVRSPAAQKASVDDGDVQRVGSPEEMYAIIDKAAKKKARQTKEEEDEPTRREIKGASPVPPPLPPVGDLGDLSEFDRPPLPNRSEDSDRLVVEAENDSGYSRVLKVGQSDSSDPPYAKVKSKVEHPYAELNIGGLDKPDLTSGGESSDASLSPTSPIVTDIPSGVATIIPTPPAAVNADPDDAESHMYDILEPPNSPCEVTVQISSPEEDDLPQNTYDSLGPVADSGDNADDVEKEGPYEEIDESTRQNLQKIHHTHSKPA